MKKLILSALFLVSVFIAFSQNVTLTTQAEVDAFDETEIEGTLTVEGEDIIDLSPLNSLRNIGVDLIIQNCPYLLEIRGFENLNSVGMNHLSPPNSGGYKIDINNNENLKRISAFPELVKTKIIVVKENPKLLEVNFESSSISLPVLFWGASLAWVDYGELIIYDNPLLERISGNFSSSKLECKNNEALVSLEGLKFDSTLYSLSLNNLPSLSEIPPTYPTKDLLHLEIVNTRLEMINQLDSLEELGEGNSYIDILISDNQFLKEISLPRLESARMNVDNNIALEKITMPKVSKISDLWSSLMGSPLVVSNNPNLEIIDIGTECAGSYGNQGFCSVFNNRALKAATLFKHCFNCPSIAVRDNETLHKLSVGINVTNFDEENNPRLNPGEIICSAGNYNMYWSETPDTFSLECTADSISYMRTLVYNNWLKHHQLIYECYSLDIDFDWYYHGPGTYDIELFYEFDYGETVSKIVTLIVSDIAILEVIGDPQIFDSVCDNSSFELELNKWIEGLGYATFPEICTEVFWSNDYIGLSDDETTIVTFTAMDSSGDIMLTFEGVINNELNDPEVEILSKPVDLEVICDNASEYQSEIDIWLENNASGNVVDPCAQVTWSNNYNFDYSVGSHLIRFEAFSQSGVILDESVTLTVLPSIEPPSITGEVEDLVLYENDPLIEQRIQIWLDDIPGVGVLYNCGDIDWSHDYNFDYSVGNHWVTFTVVADNGQSNAEVGLLSIQSCVGQWTTQAQELAVSCDQEGNYIDQVDEWIANQAGLVLSSGCDDVQYTHDWIGSYDTGNYFVTFTANGVNSGFEFSRGGFLSIQRGDAPPKITTEASDYVISENDPILESTIQTWLDSQGGAEVIDNCGSFTWSNDYTFDNSPGEYPVTFLATSDNGGISETTATLTIDMVSSIGDVDEERDIVIAPNPVGDILLITGDTSPQSYQIYDISGERLYRGNFDTPILEIDVQVLNQGLYYLELISNDQKSEVVTFVKL